MVKPFLLLLTQINHVQHNTAHPHRTLHTQRTLPTRPTVHQPSTDSSNRAIRPSNMKPTLTATLLVVVCIAALSSVCLAGRQNRARGSGGGVRRQNQQAIATKRLGIGEETGVLDDEDREAILAVSEYL